MNIKKLVFVVIVFISSLLIISCSATGNVQKKLESEPVKEPEKTAAVSESVSQPQPKPDKTPVPEQAETKIAKAEDVAIELGDQQISRDDYKKGYQKFLKENSLMDNQESKDKYFNQTSENLMFLQYAKTNNIQQSENFKNQFDALLRDFTIEYIKKNVILNTIQVSYSEIEEYYTQNADKYSEPEKIQVRFILTSTLEEAEEALKRLKQGDDFRKVASEMSIHASKNKGGELSPFCAGTYNPAFEEGSFKLKPGELSQIIKADNGYHIIEKTGEYPAKNIPLEQVKGEISRVLLEKKEKEAVKNFLNDIRKNVTIKFYPENNGSK